MKDKVVTAAFWAVIYLLLYLPIVFVVWDLRKGDNWAAMILCLGYLLGAALSKALARLI